MVRFPRARVLAVALTAVILAAASRGAAEDETAAPGSFAELIARLADADAAAGAAERAAASDELVRRGADAVPELAAALADPRLRVGVARVLERIGRAAKPAVPGLVSMAKGTMSPARAAAVRALGAIGPDSLPGLSALTAVAAAPRAPDRADAFLALERILTGIAGATPRTAPLTDVDRAISAGCDWLVRHQGGDGMYDCDDFASRCPGPAACSGPGEPAHDIGITGLASLALLGETMPPAAGRRAAIDAALAALTSAQQEDGHFGPRDSMHHNYNHACATLAFADAAARTGQAGLRGPLQAGVNYVMASRNPERAWRYGFADGDDDTSVTVWMMKALTRAGDAGITVEPACQAGALAWIESMTASDTGRTGYQQKGGPSSRTTRTQPLFPSTESESLTAGALVLRFAAGRTRESDCAIAPGLALLAARRPRWEGKGTSVDLYYWMHGSEAVRLAGGADYVAWRKDLLAAVLPRQIPAKGACDAGSWPPADAWSQEGGRVYATAAAVIALEACALDPAARPPLPAGGKAALDALTRAAADPDPAIVAAASRAASRIRNAFRP